MIICLSYPNFHSSLFTLLHSATTLLLSQKITSPHTYSATQAGVDNHLTSLLLTTTNNRIAFRFYFYKTIERNGFSLWHDYWAGPIVVRFENRRSNMDALVLSGNNEPLLGALPVEDTDLLIHPRD